MQNASANRLWYTYTIHYMYIECDLFLVCNCVSKQQTFKYKYYENVCSIFTNFWYSVFRLGKNINHDSLVSIGYEKRNKYLR